MGQTLLLSIYNYNIYSIEKQAENQQNQRFPALFKNESAAIEWFEYALDDFGDLNGEFLNSFTAEEQDRILPVHIPCDSVKSECLKTRSEAQQFSPSEIDDVFLLTISEIREFAQNSIAVRNGFFQSHSAYHWWTRTTSDKTNIMDHGYCYTSVVVCLPADDLEIIPPDHDEWIHSFADTAGSVYKTYPNISGIRPALWISFSEKPETV